ncbi:MAG: hypothetical protein LBI14_09410 [Treponema sp.]|jgi:hypothetical protein|nr:hypothetical protein [Treponema sp.]
MRNDESGCGHKIILQIFSGGFLSEAVSFEAVQQKLEYVLPRLPVQKVIMGWSRDNSKKLYTQTASFLSKRNIEFYLWFPVFSETGSLLTLSPLIDIEGHEINNPANDEEENFSFCCPNNPQNHEKILGLFEKEFASLPFDGVFLDKIRYPSFALSGFSADKSCKNVFSCFCPHCLKKYEEEGISIDDLKKALSRPTLSPLGMNAYSGSGSYAFEDPTISQFFKLKASFIYKSLSKICKYFREKKYRIGFDVFAPFLSAFVGQDLIALSSLCDFMKPMMYRITQAPAGIPFETEALLRETNSLDIKKRRNFDRLVGVNSDLFPFDLSFVTREIKDLVAQVSCDIYPGIEINRRENIAEVYPEYIEETIKAYRASGIDGLALSWNLLDAPKENIDKLISTYKTC